MQDAAEPFELWTILEPIEGHPQYSTLSRRTIENKARSLCESKGDNMAKTYKVWIEIEEYDDETGDGVDRDDLSFILPFSDSATCLTEWDAVRVAQEMHAAVNPQFEVDQDVIEKVKHAAVAND